MSIITNRRSFLFGASVAGFGIFAQGRTRLGRGRGTERDAEYRLHRRRRQRRERHRAGGAGTAGSSALCDIDQKRLDAMAARHKEAKKYNDFRELLHELDSKIDAVVVSTPDHTHAPAAVTAMRLGKHVYCQKPLAHSVWEARLMRETARQKGVCTQMGNQGTADPGFRRGAELVRSGALGEVPGGPRLDQSPVQVLEAGP